MATNALEAMLRAFEPIVQGKQNMPCCIWAMMSGQTHVGTGNTADAMWRQKAAVLAQATRAA